MQSSRIIHTVSAHAAGEVGDVIVGGVAPPPGDTLWEQRDFLARDQYLRRFMLNEPRGGVFRHVNLLVPPVHPDADAAFLIMEPEDTPAMSGSNAMCTATVLLETGILAMQEPKTLLRLEVPAGLIDVRAQCVGGRVKQVTLRNVPAFADKLDATLELPGHGALRVDTAWGGDAFVLVEAADLGLRIEPEMARDLAELGAKITTAANEQLGFSHPENPWNHFSFCEFTEPAARVDGILTGRSTVAIKPGKLDRSPCGTGTCARLAVMRARDQIAVGEEYRSVSIIGSEFTGRVVQDCTIADRPAIVPEISGQAWITGTHQHMLSPDDPWPEGYRLSDTWPMDR